MKTVVWRLRGAAWMWAVSLLLDDRSERASIAQAWAHFKSLQDHAGKMSPREAYRWDASYG